MAFFAHLGNNYTYGVPSGTVGYTVYPTTTVTGILDTIVADLSAATASGTNNGWSLFDDMRTGSFTGVLPLLNTWAGIMGTFGTFPFQFTTASLTATAYAPYGRRFDHAISAVSGVNTTCSVDLVNWFGMYAITGTLSNYSTGILDRPFPTATTGTVSIYQRVEQWIVLKHSGGQKTFYVLLGVPTNRWGGPTLYTMPMEVWSTSTRLPDGGRSFQPPLETTHIYDQSAVPMSGSTTKCQMMIWFLPDAFAIWTGGLVSYRVRTMQCFSYIGSLDTSNIRAIDPDAVAFIPGQTWYSGLNAAGGQIAIYAASVIGDAGGGAIQCLRTVQGDPWITPQGKGLVSSSYKNAYQLWPRARPHTWCVDAKTVEDDGRLLYTEFDVYHGSSDYGTTPYEQMGSSVELLRGKLKYVKCPMNNANHQHLNTVSGSDGRTYMFIKQSSVGSYSSQGQTPWFTFNPYQLGATSANGDQMSGWAWGSKISFTNQIGDVVYAPNPSNGMTGHYNYLLMPVSGAGI